MVWLMKEKYSPRHLEKNRPYKKYPIWAVILLCISLIAVIAALVKVVLFLADYPSAVGLG